MIIKQIPEDFIVEEVIDLKLVKKANYLVYKLTKQDWDTFKLLEKIARILNTKIKFIGYAGNKDKKALTTQYISFYKIPKSKIDNIKIQDIKLEFIGYSLDRINLGDLNGNDFIVNIRNLNKKTEIPEKLYLENYFDDQRFGSKGNTHLVGKAIIKRDFKNACELLNLEIKNNDYVGALRLQHRRLLRFYISSYQSFLFNQILSRYLEKSEHFKVKYKLGELAISKNNLENFDMPLISFDAKFSKRIKNIAENLLKEEELSLNDFIIKEIPELITETVYRKAFVDNVKIKYKFLDDELNKGKYKAELEFFLPKGCYATLLIKKLEIYLN